MSKKIVLKYNPQTLCLDVIIRSAEKYQKISISRRMLYAMTYKGAVPDGLAEDLKV